MRVVVLFVALCLSLGACSARGIVTLLPGEPAADQTLRSVFVASNRLPNADGPRLIFEQGFGDVRDATLRFGRVDVSIPPVHQPGKIEWPRGKRADPALHFVARAETRFPDTESFLRDLRAHGPAAGASGAQEVVVFVHGFNVNNAEAVYRLAQVAHDFDAAVPVVAFSWPSAGSPRGYAYDRDSIMFSRDGLEKLLLALARDQRKVLLVAHSMGSQLVMETLRQISISGQGAALRGLSGVALISPDIDEDVFVQQAERITPFPRPFTLMVSSRDRALNLSAFLTGKPSRLGSISEPERLDPLDVEVVDLSDIKGGDRSGHSTAFTAPAAIRLLRDMAPAGR